MDDRASTNRQQAQLKEAEELTSMDKRASTYRKQGQWKEAEELLEEIVERSKKLLGSKHPDTLASVWCHAVLLNRLGRRDEAILLYERASTGFVTALGKDHPTTHACQQELEAMKDPVTPL